MYEGHAFPVPGKGITDGHSDEPLTPGFTDRFDPDSRIGKDGTPTELFLPWEILALSPHEEMTLGLLLVNNDRDDAQSVQFDWLDLIETGPYARPELWGDLILR